MEKGMQVVTRTITLKARHLLTPCRMGKHGTLRRLGLEVVSSCVVVRRADLLWVVTRRFNCFVEK